MTRQSPTRLRVRKQVALEICLPTVRTLEVFSTLTEPHWPNPEFQVLRAVVTTDTVDVVHRLAFPQRSAQSGRHHYAVLSSDLPIVAPHQDIPVSICDAIRPVLSLLGGLCAPGLHLDLANAGCTNSWPAPTSVKRNLAYLGSSTFSTPQHTLILPQNGFSCKIVPVS